MQGQPNRQRLHPPGQRLGIRSLDDQVQVVVLHAVVDQAEPETTAPSHKGPMNGPKGAPPPQGG